MTTTVTTSDGTQLDADRCPLCTAELSFGDDALCYWCEFGFEAARGDHGPEAQKLATEASNLHDLLGSISLRIYLAAEGLGDALEDTAHRLDDACLIHFSVGRRPKSHPLLHDPATDIFDGTATGFGTVEQRRRWANG